LVDSFRATLTQKVGVANDVGLCSSLLWRKTKAPEFWSSVLCS